jgi:DNA polymerase-3 subunit epsilon
MIYLVYDTETTGLTRNGLPPHDPSQPDLIQLGAILWDSEKDMVRGEINLIIREDGVVVPDGAAGVHGIRTEIAAQFGLPLLLPIAAFNNLARIADAFVCHNAAYDLVVMKKAYYKVKKDHPFNDKPNLCTMEALTNIMRLPPSARMREKGMNKPKPPSLMEAYGFVTGGKSFDNAHDAMADVRATLEIQKWLVNHQKETAPPT